RRARRAVLQAPRDARAEPQSRAGQRAPGRGQHDAAGGEDPRAQRLQCHLAARQHGARTREPQPAERGCRARQGGTGVEGGGPPQGRVSGDAGARAAQSAGADSHCRTADAHEAHARPAAEPVAGRDRAATLASHAPGRRPARCGAHHARQDPPVARAVETVQPLIQERGHEFTSEIPAGTLRVNADPLRLTQALGNVLGNAAKYTERGGRITLTVCRQGTDVEIRVRDTGIGIPAEVLPRIFDLFTQLDRRSDHTHSGLGIGLALVRRLLQMHDGTISAHSEGPGRGSEFVIRLPLLLETTQSANGQQSGTRADAVPPVRRRILVADDNADALETLATVLELGGHEVFSAANRSLAPESAERHLPEVALLDIGMPLLDGYEVARRIRAQAWGKRITLVALTGWGQDSDRRRSPEAGFDSHLG